MKAFSGFPNRDSGTIQKTFPDKKEQGFSRKPKGHEGFCGKQGGQVDGPIFTQYQHPFPGSTNHQMQFGKRRGVTLNDKGPSLPGNPMGLKRSLKTRGGFIVNGFKEPKLSPFLDTKSPRLRTLLSPGSVNDAETPIPRNGVEKGLTGSHVGEFEPGKGPEGREKKEGRKKKDPPSSSQCQSFHPQHPNPPYLARTVPSW